MTHYDVFNGDADGICSLVQLRLSEPVPDAQLITGVKRDIKLLSQIHPTADDKVTTLDISMDKNHDDLVRILATGADVFYADHHFAGEIPEANNLAAHINTNANVCTAMIVNGLLNDQHLLWAITGAFGDNLNDSALGMAGRTELTEQQVLALKQLGILINYNGYGASLDDLHCPPAELFREVVQYSNPLDFCDGSNAVFNDLSEGYQSDFAEIDSLTPYFASETSGIYLLPNQPWARRVSGIFSNQLANQAPDRAHAVLTLKANGNYLVSVRAPLNNKTGADVFCRGYETGGGRSAAAGINDLAASELDQMVDSFDRYYKDIINS
ncbi:MAG: DHH family phosphoesterase [Gammaproteobacteria bacterium]